MGFAADSLRVITNGIISFRQGQHSERVALQREDDSIMEAVFTSGSKKTPLVNTKDFRPLSYLSTGYVCKFHSPPLPHNGHFCSLGVLTGFMVFTLGLMVFDFGLGPEPENILYDVIDICLKILA